jgi:hypothetical protein
MSYKIISYKIFQKCTSNCTGHHNHVINFEKCHVFTTLNPKFVFEKIETVCSLIMKSSAFMYTLFAFCKKTINIYMLSDE